jgi:hypothetical protein
VCDDGDVGQTVVGKAQRERALRRLRAICGAFPRDLPWEQVEGIVEDAYADVAPPKPRRHVQKGHRCDEKLLPKTQVAVLTYGPPHRGRSVE